MMSNKRRARFLVGLSIFASIFIVGGFLHFFHPDPYVRIIPPFLPGPKVLVWVSGVVELLGCLGLLLKRFRRLAAW
jgi:uncharacterized membrane protein